MVAGIRRGNLWAVADEPETAGPAGATIGKFTSSGVADPSRPRNRPAANPSVPIATNASVHRSGALTSILARQPTRIQSSTPHDPVTWGSILKVGFPLDSNT